ncbi:MAG: hypothetical protein AB8I08_21575 [Sandaracinaceae bacterium]
MDEVDKELAKAGSDVRLSSYLVNDPCRTRLGLELEDDDFPTIGHVPRDQLASLGASLDAVLPGLDPEVVDAVTQFRDWLSEAETRKGDLITFYG